MQYFSTFYISFKVVTFKSSAQLGPVFGPILELVVTNYSKQDTHHVQISEDQETHYSSQEFTVSTTS